MTDKSRSYGSDQADLLRKDIGLHRSQSQGNKNPRCTWVGENPLMIAYHDTEWGMPLHDDLRIFEYMVLDAFQAGLSWNTIINKRENFRKAFDNFDPLKISKYGQEDFDRLMADAGIIRNKQKIEATINNAQKFLDIQKEFGTFDKYIWQFVGGKPIVNTCTEDSQIRATSPESDEMSKDLKKKCFKFIGSTICYAFMQGAGMINDHLVSCFRYKECQLK